MRLARIIVSANKLPRRACRLIACVRPFGRAGQWPEPVGLVCVLLEDADDIVDNLLVVFSARTVSISTEE